MKFLLKSSPVPDSRLELEFLRWIKTWSLPIRVCQLVGDNEINMVAFYTSALWKQKTMRSALLGMSIFTERKR